MCVCVCVRVCVHSVQKVVALPVRASKNVKRACKANKLPTLVLLLD